MRYVQEGNGCPLCAEKAAEVSEAPAEEEKLEFNRETVERLLTEGVSKARLAKIFGLSSGHVYRNLERWGLHKPWRGVGRGGVLKEKAKCVQGSALSSRGQVGKEVSLGEALRMRDEADRKLKSIIWLTRLCRNELADHAYSQDILPLLGRLRDEYEAKLKRLNAVIEEVRVVI